MESSLSSILVERVIEKAVDETLAKLDFVPQFWKIYVDDHITAVPADKITTVKDLLNKYLEGVIEFTEEVEVDSKINFLDLTLHVDKSGKIRTNWYSKPIASNRLINYYSAHPSYMKNNVAKSFIRKMLTVSHRDFHLANKERITNILRNNNFPMKLIFKLYDQVVNSHLNRTIQNTTVVPERQARNVNAISKRKSYPFLPDDSKVNTSADKTNEKFPSMTYVPHLTEELCSQLRYFVPDVKIAPRPPQKLNQFYSKMKQPLMKVDLCGVVYQVPCKENDTDYIGETVQKVKTRMGQHNNDCSDTNLAKKTNKRTALAHHAKESGHEFNFDDVKILKKNKTKLRIQEVNQIIMHEDTTNICNYKSDSVVIGPTYGRLLKKFKQISNKNRINRTTQQSQRVHANNGL